jgi:hypothetical protein
VIPCVCGDCGAFSAFAGMSARLGFFSVVGVLVQLGLAVAEWGGVRIRAEERLLPHPTAKARMDGAGPTPGRLSEPALAQAVVDAFEGQGERPSRSRGA